MSDSFSHRPPAPQDGWIDRPRLIDRLNRRFEVPLTVVVAPAGYGKTSALSQAIAAARAESVGVDLWVQCSVDDVDRASLAATILATAEISPEGETSGARIADLLAGHSPNAVCLVLDDVHKIPAGSTAWMLIQELLDRLPQNGHVLLSGRVNPDVALTRRQMLGTVERIGTRDLEYNDDELAALGHDAGTGTGTDESLRWPALEALGGAGIDADLSRFLTEEFVHDWGGPRRTALSALAHVDGIDDRLADAACPGSTAADLVAGIPLVQRQASGSYQLHDLLREALIARAAAGDHVEVDEALLRIGDVLLADGRYVDAAALSAVAGAPGEVARAAMALLATPFLRIQSDHLGRMAGIVAAALGSTPIADLIDGALDAQVGDERVAAERFERVARLAAAAGDDELEVIALQQLLNAQSLIDPDALSPWIASRADELVDRGHSGALVVSVLAHSHDLRSRGRPERAAEVLARLLPPVGERERVTFAFGMVDIGRPELIDASSRSTPDHDVASERVDLAAAVWLRGAVAPEVAFELSAPLASDIAETGFAHLEVQTRATVAIVALAAGRDVEGRHFADEANARASATASELARAFAQLADALCRVVEHGEDAAAEALAALLERFPMHAWPRRPYLFALPTVYLLAPSVRPVLDRCRFGPAIQAATSAGRALVALRAGDPSLAEQLPWDRRDLLRAHVLPCHLAELLAGAAGAGHGGVGHVLAAIPDARTHLRRAERSTHPATARWASQQIASLPARPAHEMRIGALGPLRLWRGDIEVRDDDWVKRDRVRQLLAFLILNGRTSRRRVAEELWPDLPISRGLDNLRVNLTHLQRVLQPARATDEMPWFVRADQHWLELVDDGVTTDIALVDEAHRRARALDAAGRSGASRVAYHEIVALDEGDLFEEWPDLAWLEFERVRLRTLMLGARCRLGELLLSAGEPEAACEMAESVLRREPLQERAARLLIHTLTAQGDRASGHRVATEMAARLRTAGLDPEPATAALMRNYSVAP